MAMDFWASLEHKIKYKYEQKIPKKVSKELVECAKDIRKIDKKMARLGKNAIEKLNNSIDFTNKEFDEINNSYILGGKYINYKLLLGGL